MRTIQTCIWHDRVKNRRKLYWDRYVRRKPWNDFAVGNAGDIFTRNVLSHFYPGAIPANVASGPRLLCVGSIAHLSTSGDVLSGVGCRTTDLSALPKGSIHIHGLRGPISYDIFKRAGYDVSQVAFLADPGLLIGKMLPERAPVRGHVLFIPHYRERKAIRKKVPAAMRVVDIDNNPLLIARNIQSAECVYSSSLHGLIFAHALGRPCVFVRPESDEPLLKFEDYFLSVGLAFPKPLDTIGDADFAATPTSPASLSFDAQAIIFPSEELLKGRGIIQ